MEFFLLISNITDKIIITNSPVATYYISSLGHLCYCKQCHQTQQSVGWPVCSAFRLA